MPEQPERADQDVAPVILPQIDQATLAQDAADAEHRSHRRRMSPERIKQRKRRRRIRRILIAVAVLLLAVVAMVAWMGVSAMKAKTEVEAAVSVASGIQQQVMDGDVDGARAALDELGEHIDATYAQTSSPVWVVATLIPKYGSDVKAVREAVRIMEDVSHNALPQLSKAVEALDLDAIGITDGAVQLGPVAGVADELTAANAQIADAVVDLGKINGVHIPQLADALDSATARFGELSGMVDLATRVANLAPTMFDLNGQAAADGAARHYLVLVQNNAELRSTGGIPGSWGVLTVDGGRLSMDEFTAPGDDGVFADPVVPLTAEERSLFTDRLGNFYQDVNFTPDFPRTGEIATAMWRRMGGQDVDGVISVDPVFLQRLLAVTGPVTLDDGTQLTGDNTAQRLLNQVYLDIPDGDDQDAFFTMAASAVFRHLMGSVGGNMTGLVDAVRGSVEDGHLYVWLQREDEQQWVAGSTIAGEIKTGPAHPIVGVYFNDATMGKMDWYLQRDVSVDYDMTYPTGADQYTVHITLTNTADPAVVGGFPASVLGGDGYGSVRHGEIHTVLYVYATEDGRLVDWSVDGDPSGDFDSVTVHDGLTLGVKSIVLEPGQSIGMTVHVTASPVAQGHAPVVRVTPECQ